MFGRLMFSLLVVSLLVLVLTSIANAADPNLIGWWRFDGDVNDSSGCGHHGTAYGDPCIGKCTAKFDGIDDIVVIGSPDNPYEAAFDFTSVLTVSFCIKTTEWGGGAHALGKGDGRTWQVYSFDGTVCFGTGTILESFALWNDLCGITNVNDGILHHVAVVFDRPNKYIYVDGILDATGGFDYDLANTDCAVAIGGYSNEAYGPAGPGYSGSMSNVRVYDRALSSTEIISQACPDLGIAWNPSPDNGAEDVEPGVVLSWSPGCWAALHYVYFGTNFTHVINGTGGTYKLYRKETSYKPGQLEPFTTYYWRIDEVNEENVWKGNVWSFTTLLAQPAYFVAPDGNDSNPGTEEEPFRTIQKGVSMCQAGHTLYVKAGTYHESVFINNCGTANSPITIFAYPGDRPVIDGEYTLPAGDNAGCDPCTGNCYNWHPLVGIQGSYIIFDGFEVKRSRGRGIRIWPKDNNIVSNCWTHDNRLTGILVQDSNYATVENCRVWLSGDFAPYPRGGSEGPGFWPGGVALQRVHAAAIRGNEVYNNWGEGILPMASDYILVEDNIVYNNFAVNIYAERTSYVTVQRNLVYHTNEGPFLRSGNPCGGIAFADELFDFGDTPQRSSNQTVINNLVMGCSQNLAWWGDSNDPNYDESGFRNALIAHNTLVNAVTNSGLAPPYGIHINATGHLNSQIENNIILQDILQDIAIIAGVEPHPELHFSHNFWSYPEPNVRDTARGPGDIYGQDPNLALTGPTGQGQLTADYFKLLSTSPAIDEANDAVDVFQDFWRNPRGRNPDMGAHEYGADVDSDGDGVPDLTDNCPYDYNPDQTDSDRDAVGNACDGDCANLDGSNPVDFRDFSILACDWQLTEPNLPGDLDDNGIVDVNDLGIFATYWLSNCRQP